MHCYFLIPHAFKRQILLIPHSEGFSLPRWTLPADWAGRPADEHQRALLLNRAVHEQFCLTTAVLLVTSLNAERLVIFDTLYFSDLPLPVGLWVNVEELVSLPLAEPDQSTILEAWFAAGEEGGRHR